LFEPRSRPISGDCLPIAAAVCSSHHIPRAVLFLI
jgi:hypothetical protein